MSDTDTTADDARVEGIKNFLNRVITAESEGWLVLALRDKNLPDDAKPNHREWLENFYRWPDDIDKIAADAVTHAENFDVYTSSYLFKQPDGTRKVNSKKENAWPSRTIQADLDDADINNLPFEPAALVETSTGRYQGYWILDRTPTISELEDVSKRLAYAIPGCDNTGWPVGKKLRMPYTLSHKYDPSQPVRLVSLSTTTHELAAFDSLPEVKATRTAQDSEWLDADLDFPHLDPILLYDRYFDKIPIGTRKYFYVEHPNDRSGCLWSIMLYLFRAGAPVDEVYVLARSSANNKYTERRYNGRLDLMKQVLKAQAKAEEDIVSVKDAIVTIQHSKMRQTDKDRQILETVLFHMRKHGRFIHTIEDTRWYIPTVSGRPIIINAHSLYLNQHLYTAYGLNSADHIHGYVVQALMAVVTELDPSAKTTTLSLFDPKSNHVLLHTYKKDVLKITPTTITKVSNGDHGAVFRWNNTYETFDPDYNSPTDYDWADEMFDVGVQNIINYTPAQAKALLKVWFIFLLLRDGAVGRPLLACLGPPGSGKTTMMRRLYRLLYGYERELPSITTADNFDQVVSVDPLVCFDNVDGFTSWLPDRLALSAAKSDVTKRQLYTDSDVVSQTRQALIGVSAHDPKFGRADVVDRLLIFTFTKFQKYGSETKIHAAIIEQRNKMWGAIIKDIQKVLAVNPDALPEPPQMRVEDFAVLGWRIAHGIGCTEDFFAGINQAAKDQKAFTLEEETGLLAALMKLTNMRAAQNKNGHNPHDVWQTPTALWSEMETSSGNPMAFSRAFKDAASLVKKLWSLQSTLRDFVDIEQSPPGKQGGIRMWRIRPREQ